MHIILHTQYYPPEVGAPQARLHELAVELIRQGIQVTVLTAMPNYPLGRYYDGYKGWLRTECLDGVKVIRTAIFPTQSARMLTRLLCYISFVISSFVIGLFMIGRADFLITESPPLFLGITGVILSRLKRARWIFNISDLWPESVVEMGLIGREGRLYKLSLILEEALYKKAWLVTGTSTTILENIHSRVPSARIYHLSNGVDTALFESHGGKIVNNKFQVVYAGLHGLAQGLEQILFAAHKISSAEEVFFTFTGDGPEKLQLIQIAKDLDLKKIIFSPITPREKIPAVLQKADVIMVPLKVHLTGAVPSKLYEAMAMGKPVILIADSEAARIVNDSDCGIVIQPGDIDGVVSAIRYLKNNPLVSKRMGLNGRLAAVEKYDRKRISVKFAGFLTKELSKATV